MARIRADGARLSVPGLVDLSELAKREGKYRGRKPNLARHEQIIALRSAGHSIRETAELAGCSNTWVKQVWAAHKAALQRDSGAVPDSRSR